MTLNGVMALFCVFSANSGSFRAHCVKVHVRYLISWWVLVHKIDDKVVSGCLLQYKPACVIGMRAFKRLNDNESFKRLRN